MASAQQAVPGPEGLKSSEAFDSVAKCPAAGFRHVPSLAHPVLGFIFSGFKAEITY